MIKQMIKIIMSQLKIINFRDIGINNYNFACLFKTFLSIDIIKITYYIIISTE